MPLSGHADAITTGTAEAPLALLCGMQIFRFTVWSGRPTPGSSLMNLRYRDERQTRHQPEQPAAQPGSLPKSSTAAAQVRAAAAKHW